MYVLLEMIFNPKMILLMALTIVFILLGYLYIQQWKERQEQKGGIEGVGVSMMAFRVWLVYVSFVLQCAIILAQQLFFSHVLVMGDFFIGMAIVTLVLWVVLSMVGDLIAVSNLFIVPGILSVVVFALFIWRNILYLGNRAYAFVLYLRSGVLYFCNGVYALLWKIEGILDKVLLFERKKKVEVNVSSKVISPSSTLK